MQAVSFTPNSAQEDADISAAAAPLVSILGGRVVVVLGVFTALLGVQSLANLHFFGWHWLLPASMLPGGVAAVVCGWKLSRGRGWAAVASTALAAGVAVLTAGWTVLALTWGYFSLLSPLVGFASVVAGLLSALSIGACLRTDAARARLLADGLDLGN